MNLAKAILEGDRLALARLLTRVENDDPRGREALDELFPHTGKAHLVGITGSPGTGKSSLANQLAKVFRKPLDGSPKANVAIVAVDPTSPFTGGAILGDRVRMKDLHGDSGFSSAPWHRAARWAGSHARRQPWCRCWMPPGST